MVVSGCRRRSAEAEPPNNCWNEQLFTLGSWRGCLWGLGVAFLRFHTADAEDPIMGQWTGGDQSEHLWSKLAHLSQPAHKRHVNVMSACNPEAVHRSSSATNFVLFKHVFSLFLFSAALNNAAFKNDFKGLFLEPIIAFICDGLCSALRNNPAIIWDNKTPSSSSYWGDVTLTGRQSLCLGEVWDLVIWSMCCP